MLQKPQIVAKLEKPHNFLILVAMALPIIAVSFEEQLLGKLLQQLTKLYKLRWKLWNQLMKLLSSTLPPSRWLQKFYLLPQSSPTNKTSGHRSGTSYVLIWTIVQLYKMYYLATHPTYHTRAVAPVTTSHK